METALIAAIISASISLIGFFINLYIAKETRRSTIDSIKFSTAMKSKENILNELNKLCIETEKLRINCWNLIMFFQKYENQIRLSESPTIDNLNSKKDCLCNELNRLRKAFLEQFSIYFESWSTVKGTIPEDISLIISFLRHETKNIAQAVSNYLDVLESLLNSPEINNERITEVMIELNKTINKLLSTLDTIFSRANDVRSNMIIEFISVK